MTAEIDPTTIEQQFEFPEIYCPFSAEFNPHFDEVTDSSVDWVHEMGLLEQESTLSEKPVAPHFACWVHPTAPYETLCLLSDWYCWGFLEDDNRDESTLSEHPQEMSEYQQSLLAVLNEESSDHHQMPLVRAFADLHQRWTKVGSPNWQQRFRRHHIEYFAAHRWEARNRAQNYVPVRTDYIRNTRVAAGLYIVFDLATLAGNIDRSSSLYRSPIYQDLLDAAANIVCCTNDIYSLQKELAHNEMNNLIVVVSKEQNCSLQAAVSEVCELITTETRRFEELCQQISEEFDRTDNLQSHLTQLKQVISGHLKYSKETVRYTTPD